jgi:DNA-binding MarR family transcriptional regulator
VDTFGGIPPKWEREFDARDEFQAAVSILAAERFIRDRMMRVLADHELTMAQWTIMTILYFADDPELSLGLLGTHLGVHTTTISKAVDKLVTRELVGRKALDGRTTLVALTAGGREFLRGTQAALAGDRFGFVGLDAERLRAIAAALKSVAPHLAG